MKNISLFQITIAILFITITTKEGLAAIKLKTWSFSNGVTNGFSENLLLHKNIGQMAIGESSSEDFTLLAGFWYTIFLPPSDITNERKTPLNYSLQQNFPNPFNPVTTITFSLPKADNVIINLYNCQGQMVKTITNKRFKKGWHKLIYDGIGLSTGQYFYRIKTGNFTRVKKMLLIR